MRATVLLALKQVADFYKTDGVDEMVAEDSRTEFRKMLSMFKQNRTWIQL
jgi:hypothetical protein